MNDLISRQAAIESLKTDCSWDIFDEYGNITERGQNIIETISRVPSAQPERQVELVGTEMSRYIDADILGSLVDSHGNVHYEHIKSMPSMTLEEIRAEAKKYGYSLLKNNPLPKIRPCTCGRINGFKRSYRYIDGDEEVAIVCPKCDRRVWGMSERKARENWNKSNEG